MAFYWSSMLFKMGVMVSEHCLLNTSMFFTFIVLRYKNPLSLANFTLKERFGYHIIVFDPSVSSYIFSIPAFINFERIRL